MPESIYPKKSENTVHYDIKYQSLKNAITGKKALIIEQYPETQMLVVMNYYDGIDRDGTRLVRLGDRGLNLLQTIEPTLDEWKELLKEYDYLAIYVSDDYFIKNYFEPITDEYYFDNSLYKIIKDGNDVDLSFELFYYNEN